MEKKFAITIGRQYGSGGRDIGVKLSELFGVPYYDRKLITETARRTGLSREFFEKEDEAAPISWRSALSMQFGFTPEFGRDTLFRLQSQTITELAAEHSCILVGRCADYVLRDKPQCCNIFVHSPLKERIERVSSRHGITPQQASEMISRIDKSRAAYYNFYTDKRWGYGAGYHLSIDSSLLGVDQTAEFIYEFAGKTLAIG